MIPIALLVVWQLVGGSPRTGGRALPAPSDILLAGARLIGSGELFHHAWVSLERALLGLALGGGIGLVLAANGLGPLALFRQAVLPGALPSILVGFRFARGVMWLSLIVAETIATDAGIGYLAMNAREFMQTDVVVLSIILYALLGKGADVAARAAERRLLQWDTRYLRRVAPAT